MTNSVHFQDNDWLIFIDGVQVPFQQLSLQSSLDAVSSGSLVVEPDVLLSRIRPRAVVTLFCRDRYPSTTHRSRDQEILNNYLFVTSGEVDSVVDSKDPHNRGVRLSFSSDLSIFETHKGFVSGAGGNLFYGQIVGSSFINPADVDGGGTPRDLLSFATLVQTFNREPGVEETALGRHRSSGVQAGEDFGLRMLRLISWFATHNASLRMQCVRSRMLNKIAAVQDNTLELLAARSVALPLFQNAQSDLGSDDSILMMVRKLQSRVGYRFATAFLPHYPPVSQQPPTGNPELIPIPEHLEAQVANPDLFKIRREWYRNDYLWLPDLFYAPPPPCNFIFPDMLGARSTIRSFMDEPTRSVFVDSGLAKGVSLVFVSAPGIASEDLDQMLTPDQFWANFTHLIRPSSGSSAPDDSPWRSQVRGGQSINVLDQVTDEELEKGIILNWQQLDNEYMLALTRALILKDTDGSYDFEALSNLKSLVANTESTEEVSDSDVKAKAYLVYVQEWLRYKHQLQKWNRPTQVVLKGHRWIVPGFSAILFDTDTTYQTYVTGVEQSVDASGIETTTVSIDRTRPLTTFSPSALKKVEATVNSAAGANQQVILDTEAVFQADTARFEQLLEQLQEDYEAIVRARTLDTDQPDIGAALRPILRYERNWAIIVGRAEACAAVVVGTSKNTAGALTARTKPQLASALLTVLDLDKLDPAAAARIAESLPEAKAAMAAIREFNQSQINQSRNAQPAHGVTSELAAALRSKDFSLAAQGAIVEQVLSDLESRVAYPVPPSYYNEQFIDLNLLDQQYQTLLGCPPFYTGPYAAGISSGQPPLVEPAQWRRARAYGEHSKALRILSRVFPAMRDSIVDPAEGRSLVAESSSSQVPESWDDVTSSVGGDRSTMEWQHRQFLRRRAQTLGEYLATHGFAPALELFISDEPAPTPFYRMVPTPSNSTSVVRTSSGTEYTWDDSVICRIVDENTRTGEITDSDADPTQELNRAVSEAISGYDVVAGPEIVDTDGGSVVRVTVSDPTSVAGVRVIDTPIAQTVRAPRGADPLVQARRASAARRGAVFLTSGFRQDQMIAYSRRHMGSRAFDGE